MILYNEFSADCFRGMVFSNRGSLDSAGRGRAASSRLARWRSCGMGRREYRNGGLPQRGRNACSPGAIQPLDSDVGRFCRRLGVERKPVSVIH